MQTLCAICGSNPATTRDHIPPKNLYPKPIAGDMNLNTVPACARCNNGSSSDDEVFKVIIGTSTGESSEAPSNVIDSLSKTIGRNHRMANQIFSTSKTVLVNSRGPILERAVSITFDFNPYARVITRIVRALHWIEMEWSLPAEAKVTVLPSQQLPQNLVLDLMQLMHQHPLKNLNKETFLYRFHVDKDGKAVWEMQFFSRHTTYAFCTWPSAKSH